MKKIPNVLVLLLFFASGVAAQKTGNAINPWQKTNESSIKARPSERQIIPDRYQTWSLNLPVLRKALENAPVRFSENYREKSIVLTMPLPNGELEKFIIAEAEVLHPDLAKKYPGIHSYAGNSLENPHHVIRCDISPKGFRAMIIGKGENAIFIDPYAKGDDKNYIVYNKKDFKKTSLHNFECGLESHKSDKSSILPNDAELRAGDCMLRTYRLALACTGEYASFHGGTKALVLAEMNTAMNRINGIYERDVTVTMQIVPNTDTLIFLNSASDPYSNGNESAMLGENQTACDQRIGSANYDIGHVFGTGGGGIANIRAVCNSGQKGRGVTALDSPVGDPFYVDYVAHEMGHQFGANHTQNNPCGRNSNSSVEPGSGSTIMSYAGICAPNVQNQVDDYFHAQNIFEITSYIVNGAGNACAVRTTTGNNAPAANAGADKTLPAQTPFVLTGSASDADGTASLTYTWEQMDTEIAVMPPDPASTSGPAFRSVPPVSSPSRYFPNLNTLVSNGNHIWEVLTEVDRTMNFRLTVRDNFTDAGCTAEDNLVLTFTDNAGPFLVTMPNTNGITWRFGEMVNVNWNVANTNAAPVSCANVDILLSTDGGFTYPVVLASSVPNDGSHSVQVPNHLTTTARVMVKCSNSYFFDISNQNFSIQPPLTPSFSIVPDRETVTVCGTEDVVFELNIQGFVGFNEAVTLDIAGLPMGASASFSDNNVVPDAMVEMTITGLNTAPPDTYNLVVEGISATATSSIGIMLTVFNGTPSQPVLLSPADGTLGIPVEAILHWQEDLNAQEYFVQVARTPAFNNTIVFSGTVTNDSILVDGLDENTIYFWRVRASNLCDEGGFSNVRAFKTVNPECLETESTNVPIVMPDPSPGSYSSTLTVTDNFTILDVNVAVDIDHSWIGDLQAWLISPIGTKVALFDRPGFPADQFGCGSDNILAIFDDETADTAGDFENTCDGNGPYAITGSFQSLESLSAFEGESSQGTWTLEVRDNATEDGGVLLGWAVELCRNVPPPPVPTLVKNNPLQVNQGQTKPITNSFLEVSSQGNTAQQLLYQLRVPPAYGSLLVSGFPLTFGAIFSQEEINNGMVSYRHNGGSGSTTDSFVFDVFNDEGGWLAGGVFNINILFNNITATLSIDNAISCFDGNNGAISVIASGGTAPYQYSLNGGAFQSANVFSGLSNGTYSVTVKDASGFTFTTSSVNLSNPPRINVMANVNGDDITVNASGGTGSLEYSINGVDFQSNNIFNSLANGSYTITVRDDNDCTATTNAIIAVNSLVVNAVLASDITCHDENDGSIIVNAAGGTPPYEYRLDAGSYQSSNVFENLSSGNYTATVRDADGLTMTTNQVTITNPPALTVGTTVNNNEVTINASGGTGTLRYSIDGNIFQMTNVFSGLQNGDYTAYVQDENSCIATEDFTVLSNNLAASLSVIQQPLCNGSTNGVIEVMASGGAQPFLYSLNGGGYVSENVFDNLPAGTYTVTVRDDNGFTVSSNTVNLVDPPLLEVAAASTDYTITINATGGTPPLQYSLDNGAYQVGNVFQNNAPGVHNVRVKDANGCTANSTIEVDVDLLSVSAEITAGISCNGASDGQITVTASGGVAPYQYKLQTTAYRSNNVFSNLSADTYTVTVRDAGGFTSTITVTLTEPDPLVIEFEFSSRTATVIPEGGTAPYQYSFNGGPFSADNSLTDFEYGVEHSVIVEDDNGCMATETLFIELLSLIADFENVTCAGDNDGIISLSGAGGYPPYMYSINGGMDYSADGDFENLAPATYNITIKDFLDYIISGTIEITEPEELDASFSIVDNSVILSATGGTSPYMYSLDGTNYQAGSQFSNLGGGDYTGYIKDANGCVDSVQFNISSVRGLPYTLEFNVFPNPARGEFTLVTERPVGGELLVEIFNPLGELVFTERLETPGTSVRRTISAGRLASGTYQLVVSDTKSAGVKQLIIIK